jgi:hypothetical protein
MQREDKRPIAEQREAWYRRGYRDGFFAAIEEMYRLMFADRLSRQDAYDACWDFWRKGDLKRWAQGDCSKIEFPPKVQVKCR